MVSVWAKLHNRWNILEDTVTVVATLHSSSRERLYWSDPPPPHPPCYGPSALLTQIVVTTCYLFSFNSALGSILLVILRADRNLAMQLDC